ncbi:UBX domain-containing 7 [Tripterygium wilfordii]|uniref:UBX domain-containing protein n=1 Tax=Tripterygium wilfordii TaxID=458696 RepID=A0A7J7DV58_TRIWF|nr:plant UBX domain-containing protein 7-like [Tripterygium wilfordii]XP_038697693.1 plant UBX domain-containing protein 7-like [Tripterygium wilfordii]KAF5750044.1 UBX domain-containing 7 [Tripterygium wilfordii]
MEGLLSDSDQQTLVSSFLEIAVGQTADTARQFLQATSWNLDEAIQLYFVGGDGGVVASASSIENANQNPRDVVSDNHSQEGGDEVRPPLPVVRETLYDDAMLYGSSRAGVFPQEPSSLVAFRNFDQEMRRAGVWESDQSAASASTIENPRENLASLYRPPFHLMFQGSFEKAKAAASMQEKWLLVNLQSTKEFSSHMLNRDTWANEAVAQTIKTNFVFWQVYDDTSEGRKVYTYYRLDSIPVVLVIDPITGQKMRSWLGIVQPESLLEDLVPFMDGGPSDHHVTLSHKRPRGSATIRPHNSKVSTSETHDEDEELQRALAASMERVKDADSGDKEATTSDKVQEACPKNSPAYPPLPEEPKGDRNLLCRVGVRLPDGHRVQRNFLCIDPIQLLWSFCYSQLGEGDTRQFRLTQAIPGAKSLDYESKLTFGESDLANSMVLVTWE